jgi:hypothetical protein
MKVDNELKSLDEVMDTMSEEHQLQALDNQFPYLFTKAEVFLKVGPEVYRKEDFFGQPKTTDSEELEMIKNGCFQLCHGKGLSAENPFTDLDVSGFNYLMRLFHFESESRKTRHGITINGQRGALDCITFKHVMDGRTATYFNFCVYPKFD